MNHQKAIDYILERLSKELPLSLHYHSLDHTLEVMRAAQVIAEAENVNDDDMQLLLTAAAYHDSGFLRSYKNHEELSCDIARESLPKFGFDKETIELIEAMIMSTRVPQASETHLGRILCDADLDYLGEDNYSDISIGLYEELKLNGYNLNEKQWLDLQIKFLEDQQYWTDYSIATRTRKKNIVLARLKAERKKLG